VRIAEAFEEVEQVPASLIFRDIFCSINALGLERMPEILHRPVVEAIAYAAHRGDSACLVQLGPAFGAGGEKSHCNRLSAIGRA
jgi:hypothetical protein